MKRSVYLNVMNTVSKLYSSPTMGIIEVEVQNIICQSGETEQYNDESASDWF